ncbi:MAG TPA: glycoside hydrolase family 38 C-terminal domain-containing protein [Acidimicrobiales bacterium]|nr:glycoside hydrolase family 38 C-terminal domain-containing protein [Acidimicrobiales bacterium]
MTESLDARRRRARRLLRRVIGPARVAATAPLGVQALHVGGEPITLAEATARRASFAPFAVGDAWGPAWDTTWFALDGTVPAAWAGTRVALAVQLGYAGQTGFGAEGLVYRDGAPLQGISPNHDLVDLAAPATGGEVVALLVEAAANPPVVPTGPPPPRAVDVGGAARLTLARCELVVRQLEVEQLWEDLALCIELAAELPTDDARGAKVQRAVDRAVARVDPDDVAATAAAGRAELAEVLSRPAAASAHRFAAVGNAHIDTAWLWPLRETRRKAARTVATALRLAEELPDHRFAFSQPQQLAWLADDQPDLFARVRAAVASGRFEVVGAMWVEPDCNLPSGESLVRQLLHGRRWLQAELGVTPRTVWLPDVFGYPANLPQLMALAGIRWFMTQKLSWNDTNAFPHSTFWWEGIDGTRVLAHFPPAATYNGDMSVAELARGARAFAQKAVADDSLYLYGWGDGGGGPTRHHVERARRLADLEGAPRVGFSGAEEALARIEAATPADELPVWAGELYFEYHRGTYTTQANVKRANRRLERLLGEAELWSVAAGAALPWPGDELDAAWRLLLVHQFHDIIPGSSIAWVYDDTRRDHATVEAAAGALVDAALDVIAGSAAGAGTGAQPALVVNPVATDRTEVVDVGGAPLIVHAPACGWRVVDLAGATDPVAAGLAPVQAGAGWLDNGIVRVELDGDGLITSLRHHPTGREALSGPANLLQVHDDRPNDFDAWDIDAVAYAAATDLRAAEVVEVVETGPLRAAVRVVRRHRSSTVDQTLVLRAGSPALEVHSRVDWHERHQLLKAAFPTAVRSPDATFEVQFGHVRRPTHRTTTWDAARFEVCGHTWADLADPAFGVAVLNDGRYGWDVHGSVLRLTLLRSPTWPDPGADQGLSEVVYAVMPHGPGDPATAGVVAAAHALNAPLRVVPLPARPDRHGDGGRVERSLVRADDPGFVVSAVLRAEPEAAGVLVRGYEAGGAARRVRVTTDLGGWTRAQRVDLVGRPLADLPTDGHGAVTVDLRPFEVVNLLFSASG